MCNKVSRLIIILTFVAAMGSAVAVADEPHSWAGQWQVMWRGGTVLIRLKQNGDEVTGVVEPQGGLLSARVVEGVLKGEWTRDDVLLEMEYVMAEDGQTFTGRFGTTEYFNGRRISASSNEAGALEWSRTPRGSLRAMLIAGNRTFYSRDAAALGLVSKILVLEGGERDPLKEARRRGLLWRLVDMSTFHVFDAPEAATDAGTATFEIGPVNSDQRYELRFHLDNGFWKIVVEAETTLAGEERRFLDDLGYASYGEYRADRSNTPRQTMREFLLGIQDWQIGGKKGVLDTLDLSYLPDRVRQIEGPILADYLKQIIDRVGYVIFQEIPDDPAQPLPYVHYRHPLGSIVIERKVGTGGEPDRWLFSAQTLREAPALLNAMQDLPIAEGLVEPVPLTRFFRLREWLRARAPAFVNRTFRLENWQWLVLATGVILALVAARLAGWLTSALFRAWQRNSEPQPDELPAVKLDWPVRVTVAGLAAYFIYAALGLADGGLTFFGSLAALVLTVGLGFLVFRLVGTTADYFAARAEGTSRYVDEIVTALAAGLMKLLVVVFTIIVCADIVNLPYEGVVAGLGLGGVALAFASRDTLSNMLGAIMLLADRPFKRGDLIETEGKWARVESVGLRSTRLRTFDDSLLIIPNAQLSDKAIENWGIRRRRQVLLKIGLKYSTPREKLDQFVDGLRDVYEAQPRADTSEFYVGLKEFGPSSLDIEFWGYFKVYGYKAQLEAQNALMGDIVDLAKKVGVSFAFPTRSLHIEQAEETVQTLKRAAE